MSERPSIFSKSFMRHVFHGAHSGGFHYEGAGMRAQFGARVIEETRAAIGGKGIYTADVMIRGGQKKTVSHFFPQSWTRLQVVEAIKEAYATRRQLRGARQWMQGWSETYNMRIIMHVDNEGHLCTAFPTKGKPRTPEQIEKRREYRLRRKARRQSV
jgi:hypothetical protein